MRLVNRLRGRALPGWPQIILAAAIIFLPLLLSGYWRYLVTTMVIGAIVAQSVGVVSGRAGMISLCQLSFAAIGAWVTAWLNISLRDLPIPFPVQVLIGALAAVPIGVLIGLPALRLRGVNLATMTLAFGGALNVVLVAVGFPGDKNVTAVQRGMLLADERVYLWFCVLAFGLIALALHRINNRRLGAAWLAVQHSERAAAAMGVRVALAKLSAFAVSAFIAGVAGGLLVGLLGIVSSRNFEPLYSLTTFVVGVTVGAQYLEGAIIAGVLGVITPAILSALGLPQDIGNFIFAVGTIQALKQGTSIAGARRARARVKAAERAVAIGNHPRGGDTETRRHEDTERDAPHLRVSPSPCLPAPVSATARPALEVRGLSVCFGQVVALDRVDLVVPEHSVVALIGPNGAGKTTLVDVVTGFIRGYQGQVRLNGDPIDRCAVDQRARMGVRRTFQQDRTVPDMTIRQYLRLVAGRDMSDAQLLRPLTFLNCPPLETLISTIDVGTRRLIEIAGALAAQPAVVLLDEPAAGLAAAESVALGRRIAEIPHMFRCAVLLIEHDMDLVQATCSSITVLDFGRVIASGTPRDVFSQESVLAAYLGVEERELEGVAWKA